MPSPLATRASCAVAARTWETLPADDGVLHRLDAVNDDEQGPLGLDRRRDERHVRLVVQQQVAARDAQPLRPQLDLRRRLLAGDIKRLTAPRRKLACYLGE